MMMSLTGPEELPGSTEKRMLGENTVMPGAGAEAPSIVR